MNFLPYENFDITVNEARHLAHARLLSKSSGFVCKLNNNASGTLDKFQLGKSWLAVLNVMFEDNDVGTKIKVRIGIHPAAFAPIVLLILVNSLTFAPFTNVSITTPGKTSLFLLSVFAIVFYGFRHQAEAAKRAFIDIYKGVMANKPPS